MIQNQTYFNHREPIINTRTQQAKLDDIGKFILRFTLGALILLHGIAKITGGIGFIGDVVVKAGLPAAFAYMVYVGEVLAPVMIMIGLWTRAGAAIIAINMLFAILLVHAGEIFKIGQTGGWQLELQGMFLFAAVAVTLLGAGRYSIQGTGNRWN